MREIWMMQPRFEKRVGQTPFGLVEQPRFRAGFDFLRLRADAGEVDVVLADWWQEFSLADDAAREDLILQVKAEHQKRPREPRPAKVHRVPAGSTEAAAQGTSAPDSSAGGDGTGDDAPAKKRRRRRRKPVSGGPAPEAG
jgi:poly(A) polymerase